MSEKYHILRKWWCVNRKYIFCKLICFQQAKLFSDYMIPYVFFFFSLVFVQRGRYSSLHAISYIYIYIYVHHGDPGSHLTESVLYTSLRPHDSAIDLMPSFRFEKKTKLLLASTFFLIGFTQSIVLHSTHCSIYVLSYSRCL